MPKVPQVFSPGETGRTPGPRLDPEGFARLTTSGLARGAEELGQATKQYEHIYTTLRSEEEKLDAERALGEAQRQFADSDIELKQDASITPEQYPQEVERRLRTIREGVSKSLKYPGSRLLFERAAQKFAGDKIVAAKYEGLTRMHAQVKASTEIVLRDDENLAVFGPTPEVQEQAVQRGLGRITGLAGQRILSGDEANSRTASFLGRVEEGRIRRDFRNPDLRPHIITGLAEGRYTTLSPDRQLTFAQQLQNDADQEALKLDAQRQAAWKRDQEAAVSDLFARAADKDLTIPELEQARRTWRLARTDYDAIRTELAQPGAEAASDPAVLDRVIADTESSRPSLTERDLTRLRQSGKLNRQDWKAALGRVREARTAAETDTRQDYGKAEAELQTALGVPTMFDRLDPVKERAWGLARAELRRRAFPAGGQRREDPFAVLEEIAPRYVGMLGADARLDREKLLGMARVQGFESPQQVEEAFTTGRINRGQYDNLRKLFMEIKAKEDLVPTPRSQPTQQAGGGRPPRRTGPVTE